MGRPTTPEYTKKRFRYSAIEKTFKEMADELNDNDLEVVQRFLSRLKEKAI